MSVSCVGTCSACGVRRLWLSGTMSLQMDDGALVCLPHPGESGACESRGLTLAQASQRGRLFRESFFVCHRCGRSGEIIEQLPPFEDRPVLAFTVRGSLKFSVWFALIGLPVTLWIPWWEGAVGVAATAVAGPWIAWRERRKQAAEFAARGLPRSDAPGQVPVGLPTRGVVPEFVVGHKTGESRHGPTATGPCCDRPDWRWSGCERDNDKIPCYACGRGVMTVTEQSIH